MKQQPLRRLRTPAPSGIGDAFGVLVAVRFKCPPVVFIVWIRCDAFLDFDGFERNNVFPGQIQIGGDGDVIDFKQRLRHKPLNCLGSESMNFAEAMHHRQADRARASVHIVIFETRPIVEFFKTRDCLFETVISA